MSRRVHVLDRDNAPARSTPVTTGAAFVATVTERGNFDPQKPCRSITDFEAQFGTRQSYGYGWDWANKFFRDNGNLLYVSPVRGPAAAAATLNLAGSSGTTLIATASSVGEWANGAAGGLTVEVANGPTGASTRVLIVRRNGVEVERTLEATDQAGVILAASKLAYVIVTTGGGTPSLPTVAAAANLTGGGMDRPGITSTQVAAALALFIADLGPGQEACPDWQSSTFQLALLTSADAHQRFAVPDTPLVTSTGKSTLLTTASALQGTQYGSEGMLYAPWLTLKGISGGTTRVLPMSALVCAKLATTDATDGPDQIAAGEFGITQDSDVLGLTATFNDTDAADLEAAGVNLAIIDNFQVKLDGNRTLVSPTATDTRWLQASNARFRMALRAQGNAIGRQFVHRKITPFTIAAFDTALVGMMQGVQDSLWPGDDDPGFIVDTGPAVNTDALIGAGQLTGVIGYRPAKGADMVYIYLSKVGIADSIG